MGHTQCISQTRESDSKTLRAREQRCVSGPSVHPQSKSSGASVKLGHMILPGVAAEKPAALAQLKGLVQGQGVSMEDVVSVKRAMAHLQQSGWYWGSLTAAQAKQVLSDTLEGTFLLRDSSNPSYLLTLSVKTSLGPTHLRIEHSAGAFGFDSLAVARPRLRRFAGAVELVLHYAAVSCGPAPACAQEGDGGLQLRLTRPLCSSTPSLQHLCRVAINRHCRSGQDLDLPARLKAYLNEYPFSL